MTLLVTKTTEAIHAVILHVPGTQYDSVGNKDDGGHHDVLLHVPDSEYDSVGDYDEGG